MKVFTVEWHGDYDGGEVEAIFDSMEKAQALLTKIQHEGAKAERFWDRAVDRMHKIKNAMGYPNGTLVPYEHKWNRVWNNLYEKYNNSSSYRYTYEDYSIREYDVQ